MVERLGDTVECEASEALAALDGSSIHTVLEWAMNGLDSQDWILERRWHTEVLGWKVSGQSDLIHKPTKLLQDYKKCPKNIHTYGPKEDWEKQLNVYRWMASLEGVEIDKLQVIAWYKGWSKVESVRGSGYPPLEAELHDIPVWSLEKTKQYVEDRVRVHQAAAALPLDKQPLCTEEERWQKKNRFAIMVKGNQKATAVHDTKQEALDYMANKMNPDALKNASIEGRTSDPMRCTHYCPVRFHCDFGKKYARR